MTHSMRQFWCFLAACIVGVGLSAQSGLSQAVSLAGATAYQGRVDDMSDVTLRLACTEKRCSGELIYLRSQDVFKLEGTRRGEQLDLKEYDRTGTWTGDLTGTLKGSELRLDWTNLDGTVGSAIRLETVNRLPDFPTFCGDNKWINAYDGELNGVPARLILQRVDNHRLLGNFHFSDERLPWQVRGTLENEQTIRLDLLDEQSGRSQGTIRGVFKLAQPLTLTYYDPKNVQEFATFRLVESLPVSCLEYADFYTSYDFLYPKTTSAIFNEWMVLLTQDWITDCRKQVQAMRKQSPTPALRASQRAYTWSDVTTLNDQFISGLLTHQATWSDRVATRSFNYDLQNGERLELEGLFKKGFDYQLFIKKFIADEIIKTPFYKSNAAFREWVKNQPFVHFTIELDGLALYTDYHAVYGRQRVLIPFKKIKKNVRKNAPIRALY